MPTESVWDYPRPPRLEKTAKRLIIRFDDIEIGNTTNGYRILETSHPPVYYLPPADLRMDLLHRVPQKTSFCEFKGRAIYWSLITPGKKSIEAAWSYPQPTPQYAPIKDHLAFYASRVDACSVDGELVQAQEGDFYGGWITAEIKGPFKGGAGTWGW